ncbi:hypothetical protein EJ110_NYTH05022 [Nymphaea thermarum]|nr:hypothetical protein EJ110_NYTH05022 [Nymphaea thermarum]
MTRGSRGSPWDFPSKRRTRAVPMRRLLEIGPPSPLRYLIGAMVMMVGIVLPVGYMMFRSKRIPSASAYSKQT